jgi:hypothetical protein
MKKLFKSITMLFSFVMLLATSGCFPALVGANPTVSSISTRTPLPTLSPLIVELQPGEAVLHPSTGINPYAFYSYFPKSAAREKNIAVGVWNESADKNFDNYEYCIERAKDYLVWLSQYSERYKIPIVVMAIPGDERLSVVTLHSDTFSNSDYLLSRPDLKLIDAVWNQYIPSLKKAGFVTNDKILMLGDQGSGIFPHRFSILHPKLVQALWLSSSAPAPLPTSEINGVPLDYPLGTRNLEELTGESFDLGAYLKIHQLIFAGEFDDVGLVIPDFFPDGQWQFIKTNFGNTDAERLEFFYNYLKSIGASASFRIYEGIGNRLTDEMMNDGFEFLVSYSWP